MNHTQSENCTFFVDFNIFFPFLAPSFKGSSMENCSDLLNLDFPAGQISPAEPSIPLQMEPPVPFHSLVGLPHSTEQLSGGGFLLTSERHSRAPHDQFCRVHFVCLFHSFDLEYSPSGACIPLEGVRAVCIQPRMWSPHWKEPYIQRDGDSLSCFSI